MRKIIKALTRALDALVVILTGKDAALVDAGLADYSGQGRDKYGR